MLARMGRPAVATKLSPCLTCCSPGWQRKMGQKSIFGGLDPFDSGLSPQQDLFCFIFYSGQSHDCSTYFFLALSILGLF